MATFWVAQAIPWEAKGSGRLRLTILLGLWYSGIHNAALFACLCESQAVIPSSILCSAGDPFSGLLPVELVSLCQIASGKR